MKWTLWIVTLACCACSGPSTDLRVATWNLRFDNPADGEDAWPLRRDWVLGIVQGQDADLYAFQEAVGGQVDDLERALPGYARVGVGRDDGARGGEFSPLFYRSDRFDALESGTWWLAPFPDSVGIRGWDAALPRVASWARLRDRRTGRELVFGSTHFDHLGELARVESARMLVVRLPIVANGAPIILAGDFNFADSSEGYSAFSGAGWTDAWIEAGSPLPRETFTGFAAGPPAGDRIDYVFTLGGFGAVSYAAGEHVRNARRASDHRPVVVEFAERSP